MSSITVRTLRISYEASFLSESERRLNATAELQLQRSDGPAISLPVKITDLGMLSRLQAFFGTSLPLPTETTMVEGPLPIHEDAREPEMDSVPSEVLALSNHLREEAARKPTPVREELRIRVEPVVDEADEANQGLRSI